MSMEQVFDGDFSVVDRPVEQDEGLKYGLFLLEMSSAVPWSAEAMYVEMLLAAFFEPGVWRNGINVFGQPDFAPYDADNDSAWIFWSTQGDAETLVDILSENGFDVTLRKGTEWL